MTPIVEVGKLTDVGNDVFERARLDGRVNCGRGQRGVDSKKDSDITRDVGGSHGSSTSENP